MRTSAHKIHWVLYWACFAGILCSYSHKWVVPSKEIKYTKATVTQSHFEKPLLVCKQGFSISWSVCKWVTKIYITSVLCLPIFAPTRERCSEPAGDCTGSYWSSSLSALEFSPAIHYAPEGLPGFLETQKDSLSCCLHSITLPGKVFKPEGCLNKKEPPRNQCRQLPLTPYHLKGKGFPL